MRIDSKKIRNAAKGQSCIKCGRNDGTTVLAHYSGLYSHRLGKSMGKKCEDIFGAHLCFNCHSLMDKYHRGNSEERAAEFMLLCLLTIKRLFEQRIVEIT